MGGDALDRDEEEEEEDGEDGEAFGGASLRTLSTWFRRQRGLQWHTITPWSQAKMASSYRRVTRSQRAVMYPAKKIPKVRIDTGCIEQPHSYPAVRDDRCRSQGPVKAIEGAERIECSVGGSDFASAW